MLIFQVLFLNKVLHYNTLVDFLVTSLKAISWRWFVCVYRDMSMETGLSSGLWRAKFVSFRPRVHRIRYRWSASGKLPSVYWYRYKFSDNGRIWMTVWRINLCKKLRCDFTGNSVTEYGDITSVKTKRQESAMKWLQSRSWPMCDPLFLNPSWPTGYQYVRYHRV
jgi:hypothetical protein